MRLRYLSDMCHNPWHLRKPIHPKQLLRFLFLSLRVNYLHVSLICIRLGPGLHLFKDGFGFLVVGVNIDLEALLAVFDSCHFVGGFVGLKFFEAKMIARRNLIVSAFFL